MAAPKVARRRIEFVPMAEIAPADVNPKSHSLSLLEDSVTRFGFVEPIVRDERTGKLVAGHGRLETLVLMAQRGMAPPDGVDVTEDGSWLVPVIRGWSSKDDKEAQAYLLASNRITERGGWDSKALAAVLSGLDNDLVGVGFDRTDVDDLLAKLQESQEVAFENQNRRQAEARTEHTYDSYKDGYADKGVRSIVLDYAVADYERIVDLAAVARKNLGLDSNSELFLVLVESAANGALAEAASAVE